MALVYLPVLIRLSYSDANLNGSIATSEIVEEDNYYAFGMKHLGENNVTTSTNPAQQLKYNGKEYQDELDLNLYDYGARNYDPALGRWMNIDPLAEVSRRWTPYNYCYNNPVVFVDPDGMKAKEVPDAAFSDWAGGPSADNQEAAFKGMHSNIGGHYRGSVVAEEGSWSEVDDSGGGDDDKGKGKGKGERKGGKPSKTPPPEEIPEGWERAKPKNKRPRYTLPNGDIVEWDPSHGGEWERYNPRGKHKGVWSPDGKTQVKPPVPGRKIDPIVVDAAVKTAAAATAVYIIYKVAVAALTWECLGCGLLLTP